ncbi:uncharacterized protein LOC142816008 [Rhipicephalus microplus]|uniref:uncharacterized protein LOC142816008 n=1 Tax=Rhipicephalus microplus TaxID=6941 RepID=UPI003F6D01EE
MNSSLLFCSATMTEHLAQGGRQKFNDEKEPPVLQPSGGKGTSTRGTGSPGAPEKMEKPARLNPAEERPHLESRRQSEETPAIEHSPTASKGDRLSLSADRGQHLAAKPLHVKDKSLAPTAQAKSTAAVAVPVFGQTATPPKQGGAAQRSSKSDKSAQGFAKDSKSAQSSPKDSKSAQGSTSDRVAQGSSNDKSAQGFAKDIMSAQSSAKHSKSAQGSAMDSKKSQGFTNDGKSAQGSSKDIKDAQGSARDSTNAQGSAKDSKSAQSSVKYSKSAPGYTKDSRGALPGSTKSSKGAQGSPKSSKSAPPGSTKSSKSTPGTTKGSTSTPSSAKGNLGAGRSPKSETGTPRWSNKNAVPMLEAINQASFRMAEELLQTPPPPKPNRSKLLIIGVAIFVVVIGLLVIMMFLRGSGAPTGGVTSEICQTPPCMQVARLLLDSMSPDVNPCNNFYQHVCGGWKFAGSQGDVLFEKLVGDVAELSRAIDVPPSGQSPVQKAARAYKACEDIVANNNTNLTTLVQVFKEAGFYSPPGWTGPVDALNATFYLHFRWRIAAPMKFTYVRPARRGITLRMAPSESLKEYGLRRQKHGFYDDLKKDYDMFRTTYEAHMLPNLAYEKWKTMDVNVVAALVESLDSLNSNSSDEFAGWNENNIQGAIRGVSQKQWMSILNAYFNRSDSLRFYVDSVSIFRKFMQLPHEFSTADAQAYYRWYVAEILTRRLYAPWIIREFPTYADALKSQYRFCFAILEQTASYAFFAPYVAKMFTTDVKNDMRVLLQLVRRSYDDLFAEGDQLRSNVKMLRAYANDTGHVFDLLSLSQERALKENYATYEDMTPDPLLNWKRLMTGRSTSIWSHVSMGTAGALPSDLLYYRIDGVSNDIILRPDVAVLPAYHSGEPVVLKIASLGSLMASAMAKVLCVTLENTARWRAAADCMFNLRDRSNDTESADAKMVILQRVIALAVTVSAAMKVTKYDKPLTIPGLPDLTGLKLLYAVWCYQQCGEPAGSRLCNEPLKEIGVFADAFQCDANIAMRRARTCTADWFNPKLRGTTVPDGTPRPSGNTAKMENTTQSPGT